MSDADEPRPARTAPAAQQLRFQLGQQLLVLQSRDPGVRLGTDAEDLKRFRIATRRARALIRVSRRLLGDQLAELETELRWLGGILGPTRDLDVLLRHLRAIEGDLGDGGGTIIALFEQERIEARQAMLAALESPRYAELLSRFATELELLATSTSDIGLGKLAEAETRRLRKAYRSLGADPADDDLHLLRIRVKRARFSTELAARARREDRLRALKGLQDVIGEHQDSVVAEQRVRSLAEDRVGLAVEPIIEIERARQRQARAELAGAWKRVRREL
ncbi:MAG TPA: CHAD domain-containing protein [Gaiellaceae bacterium]|nr:CHAD domain-containing protein [Gaiellaceae bacterium]